MTSADAERTTLTPAAWLSRAFSGRPMLEGAIPTARRITKSALRNVMPSAVNADWPKGMQTVGHTYVNVEAALAAR